MKPVVVVLKYIRGGVVELVALVGVLEAAGELTLQISRRSLLVLSAYTCESFRG